jgi:type I restriction enzyme R subunit
MAGPCLRHSFWKACLEGLFGSLPAFFKDEDELRTLWSLPDTRKTLLEGLAERGFSKDVLVEMQSIIDAENSDLFDVLSYVAFSVEPLLREERAAKARSSLHGHFSEKQEAFIDFVLSHYVREGVEELEPEKLSPLLRLKYNNSLSDAFDDLGQPALVQSMFVGFQSYLYQNTGVAKPVRTKD